MEADRKARRFSKWRQEDQRPAEGAYLFEQPQFAAPILLFEFVDALADLLHLLLDLVDGLDLVADGRYVALDLAHLQRPKRATHAEAETKRREMSGRIRRTCRLNWPHSRRLVEQVAVGAPMRGPAESVQTAVTQRARQQEPDGG